jgi:ribosomal protein L24E
MRPARVASRRCERSPTCMRDPRALAWPR